MNTIHCPCCDHVLTEDQIRSLHSAYASAKRKTFGAGPGRPRKVPAPPAPPPPPPAPPMLWDIQAILGETKISLRRRVNVWPDRAEALKAVDLLSRRGRGYSAEELNFLRRFKHASHVVQSKKEG